MSGITLRDLTSKIDVSQQGKFQEIVERRIERTKDLFATKGQEYQKNDNPFHNFDTGASFSNTSAEKVLFGFLLKHLVSVKDMIDNLEEGQEPTMGQVDEKIGDVVAYMILLEGLFKRRILR